LSKLCENLANNPNSSLRYLELYDNLISHEGKTYFNASGIVSLSNLLNSQERLEYVGLAKNNIVCYDDIKELFSKFGKFKLNEEET
jgi:hypothetical protein